MEETLDNNEVVGGVLMNLSKASDCIPHDLLIAKSSAYGFDKTAGPILLILFLMISFMT